MRIKKQITILPIITGGVYLKANYDPFRYLRIFAGIRYDMFSGELEDNMENTTADMKDFDIFTYKSGVIVTPSDKYSIYANYSTTYQLPYKMDKYGDNVSDEEDLYFWEMGLKFNPVEWAQIRYAYFQSNEEVVRWVEGEYINEGDAIRRGHEVELNLIPIENLELFAGLTLQTPEYEGGENDGKKMAAVPDYVFNIGVQYDYPKTETGGRVWYRDIGKWYTDASNEHSYVGYQVVDLSIYQKIAKKWTIALDAKNLLDEEYSEYVGYWSGSSQYMGSNPRSFYVTLKYDM